MDENRGRLRETIFPTLNDQQISRLTSRGTVRQVSRGEILVDPSSELRLLFVVISGGLDLGSDNDGIHSRFATLTPGMFTGELSMLTGRRGLVRISAAVDSAVLQINRNDLLELLRSDNDLGDVFLGAFI